MIEPADSGLAASELSGSLYVQPEFQGFSPADIEAAVLQIGEGVRTAAWAIGDLAIAYIAPAGTRVSDRSRALAELASATGIEVRALLTAVRHARTYDPEVRARYRDKPMSWFAAICDRTHVPGETYEERQSRRLEYADRCAEMSVRETVSTIKAELDPLRDGPEDPRPDPPEDAAPPALPPAPRIAGPADEARQLLLGGIDSCACSRACGTALAAEMERRWGNFCRRFFLSERPNGGGAP